MCERTSSERLKKGTLVTCFQDVAFRSLMSFGRMSGNCPCTALPFYGAVMLSLAAALLLFLSGHYERCSQGLGDLLPFHGLLEESFPSE